MIANEEYFGTNAGKIWETLNGKGPMSFIKLCGAARLDEEKAWGALGWLGREGKIKIEKSKKAVLFSLA